MADTLVDSKSAPYMYILRAGALVLHLCSFCRHLFGSHPCTCMQEVQELTWNSKRRLQVDQEILNQRSEQTPARKEEFEMSESKREQDGKV